MMYADNHKISLRQLYRIYVFDLIGVSSLLLPPILAEQSGIWGCLSIILGATLAMLLLLLCRLWMQRRQLPPHSPASADMDSPAPSSAAGSSRRHPTGRLIPGVLAILLGILLLIVGGFVLGLFSDVMKKGLIPEQGHTLIALVILGTALYAVAGGIESRARVYEVLFIILAVLLVLLLLLAAKDVAWDYLLKERTRLAIHPLLLGTWYSFLVFTPVLTILLFPEYVSEDSASKLTQTVCAALCTAAATVTILYGILIGNFGSGALQTMEFPLITLMGSLSLRSSFLRRFDAFMIGIWFFALFATLDLFLFHGMSLLRDGCRRIHPPGNPKNTPATGSATTAHEMKYLIFSGIIVFLFSGVLTGCGATELEDRCFPMLAVVDISPSGDYQFEFGFPQLNEKGDTDIAAATMSDQMTSGVSLSQAVDTFLLQLDKKADCNHVKILLIGTSVLSDPQHRSELFDYFRESELLPRNVYVCESNNVQGILASEQDLSSDVGTYLETYLLTHSKEHPGSLTTLGKLMDAPLNHQNVTIPQIIVRDNRFWWEDSPHIKGSLIQN